VKENVYDICEALKRRSKKEHENSATTANFLGRDSTQILPDIKQQC
jgi:hypothetical protein